MTATHQLRPGIHYCLFEGCTIILDVDADRYWRVSEAAGQALASLHAGHPVEPDMLARLETLKLVVAGSGASAEALPLAVMASALEADGDEPFSAFVAADMLTCQIWAKASLTFLSLRSVLAIARRLQNKARHLRRRGSIETLAQSFRRHRALLPWTPQCLPDTLAFVRFAARHGHSPRLVIAVEAYPFTAHCWAQQDGLVLNDAFDHVARLHPILCV